MAEVKSTDHECHPSYVMCVISRWSWVTRLYGFIAFLGGWQVVGWYYSFRRRDMNEAAQQITADKSRLRKMPLRYQVSNT